MKIISDGKVLEYRVEDDKKPLQDTLKIDGRTYKVLNQPHEIRPYSTGKRVALGFRSLALTLLSGFFGLASARLRDDWDTCIRGSRKIIHCTPETADPKTEKASDIIKPPKNTISGTREYKAFGGPLNFFRSSNSADIQKHCNQLIQEFEKRGAIWNKADFNKFKPISLASGRMIDPDNKCYYYKHNQIERIFGAEYIAAIAKNVAKGNTTWIKVPNHNLAIMNDNKEVVFNTKQGQLVPKSLQVFTDEVKEVARALSLDEAKQFAEVLEKTAYQDFTGKNFLVADDGIYFIDTEGNAFGSKPDYPNIKKEIVNRLPDDLKSDFLKFVDDLEADYNKNPKVVDGFRLPDIDTFTVAIKQ